MNPKTILYTIIALIMSSSVFLFNSSTASDPQEVYRVYLDGQSIGLIYSKAELEDYINEEEETIKNQYNVVLAHMPI